MFKAILYRKNGAKGVANINYPFPILRMTWENSELFDIKEDKEIIPDNIIKNGGFTSFESKLEYIEFELNNDVYYADSSDTLTYFEI